jgi:hypothetical protein
MRDQTTKLIARTCFLANDRSDTVPAFLGFGAHRDRAFNQFTLGCDLRGQEVRRPAVPSLRKPSSFPSLRLLDRRLLRSPYDLGGFVARVQREPESGRSQIVEALPEPGKEPPCGFKLIGVSAPSMYHETS